MDDSLENLNWIGNLTGNAKIMFGDLDNDMLSKSLGIIKVNTSFSVINDEFTLDKVLLSAAVGFAVPAKKESWQASQGLNQVEIKGFAKLNYPCQSIEDPFTKKMKSLPFLYGQVTAKLAMNTESDPLIIGGMNPAKGTVAYHCWGGQKLDVYLE